MVEQQPPLRIAIAALGVAYLTLLASLAHAGVQLVSLDAARVSIEAASLSTLLQEFLQPLRW